MVNIEYTGVGGSTTRFGAKSADEAMARLKRINGYNGNLMDSVAANLAGAFASRNNINAQRVNVPRRIPTRFSGVPSGNVYSSRDGAVAKVDGVSGLAVKDGKLVSTSRSNFVNEAGSVVALGGLRDEKIADLPSAKEVEDTARKVAESVSKAILDGRDKDKAGTNTVRVVTGIKFEANNGPLKITVETAPIKAEMAGSASATTQQIGEEVMVHESMSVDRHSLVYVISRKSNVSPSEAKVLN